MDNSPEDITLTDSQFQHYLTQCLHIRSPAGDYLESIGHYSQQDLLQTNLVYLRGQVALIDALLAHIDNEVEFPKQAVLGLAGLMDRLAMSFKG